MKPRLLHVDDEFLSYDKDCQAILYFKDSRCGLYDILFWTEENVTVGAKLAFSYFP